MPRIRPVRGMRTDMRNLFMRGLGMPGVDHLIFLHIPKTAGTTLEAVIRRQYPRRQIFAMHSVRDSGRFTSLPEDTRRRTRVLYGHMPFGLHAAFPDGVVEYVTILRDPVARVVSTYNHFFSSAEKKFHGFYDEFHRNAYSLRQFVESGKIANVDNCMVRFLSGEFDRPFGECDATMLDKAVANLERFSAVGLNEQFDAFLLRLADRYGWKRPYYVRRRVAAGGVPASSVDEATLECVREYNRFDLELYRMMKPRIEAEQRQGGAGFESRLASFQARNRQYARYFGWLPQLP